MFTIVINIIQEPCRKGLSMNGEAKEYRKSQILQYKILKYHHKLQVYACFYQIDYKMKEQ